MRIGDWSSDVRSSDLAGRLLLAGPCPAIDAVDPGPAGFSGSIVVARFESLEEAKTWADADPYVAAGVYVRTDVRPFNRSEEHKSELQSLMRNSYAVLCLKKKKIQILNNEKHKISKI